MAHKNLIEPHLLLASSNPYSLMRNLEKILSTAEIEKIKQSLLREITLLHGLGMLHFQFARSLEATEWRQRASRFYYAAYNVKRALSLCDNGKFSTDVSDHQQIDTFALRKNARTLSW